MKLAFFVAKYPVLSETFVTRQIYAMHALGHSVTVVTGQYQAESDVQRNADIPIKVFRQSSVKVVAGNLAKSMALSPFKGIHRKRVIEAVRSSLLGVYSTPVDVFSNEMSLGDYDFIVSHFGPAGVRAMFLRDSGAISGRLITIFHGFDVSRRDIIAKYAKSYARLFRAGSLFIPISALWKKRLLSWGAPESRTTVIHVGVAPAELHFAPRASISTPLKIVTVARLVEKKGISDALHGLAMSSAKYRYTVIGTGPLLDSLRLEANNLGVNATFAGAMQHNETLRLVREADLLILPSVTASTGDMEGIPVSLMEAMAIGTVVIATRHSAIPELVEHGATGFLVDEHDPSGIGAIIDEIDSGVHDLNSIRQAAMAKVSKDFNNELLDKEFEGLLLSLLP